MQALAPLGALFGGAGAGWTADLLGRKPTLLLSAVPNLIGWLLLALANYCTTPTLFKFLLLAGRFVTGVATGWSLLCAPVSVHGCSGFVEPNHSPCR